MTEPIKVLLVEDNPADADLMRETIEMSKLHLNMDVVKDGVEAIQYLRGEAAFTDAPRPDLILLDLNLPKMNGRQVLALVKSDADLRGIPVVVLTSSGAEQDIVQSYDLGANCYVIKPVDLKAFQSIVKQVESFWFTVVKAAARERADKKADGRVTAAARQASFKLLLVEDNPGDADLARERLSDIPDYDFEITSVTRLADAVRALEEAPVDAVILDLNLPDSHGLETLRRLRRIRREMAIIVLSGNTDDHLRGEALREGAQEFLSKSEPTSRLVARSFVYALERHRSEEQHRRIEHLVSANPDALIAVDEQNIVRFANAAALSLFGKSSEAFIGQPLGYRIDENQVSEIQFKKDGETRTAEMRAAAFEFDGTRSCLAAIRDVTEQKQLTEQLMQSRKMEALGLLAGGVAHDFNNLLTVIINCATFLSDAIDASDPNHRDVQQILGAADRAEALVGQLLALTRKKPIQPRVVDLADAVTGLEVLLHRTLPADIEIRTEFAPGLWPVYADRGRIDQLMMNLAVNAKDAMPHGGRLTVALENTVMEQAAEGRPAGDYVSLKVGDTGEGIPPEVLRRVFDPFFTTKAPGKGTGLGLATCYAIAHQAGGDIAIQSKLGAGTTVFVLLPRALGVPDEDPASDCALEPLGGDETILVVEDDPGVLNAIATTLGKYGYLIISAATGEEGLRIASTYGDDIDLVLSDIVMPGMNGHQLAGAIKQTRPAIKMLLMTGYDKVQDDAVEPADILFKPFRPAGLLRRVRETLDGAGKKTATAASAHA